jgi:hypothetical protein
MVIILGKNQDRKIVLNEVRKLTKEIKSIKEIKSVAQEYLVIRQKSRNKEAMIRPNLQ